MAVPKLQEIVIERLLRYANIFGCLFQCDSLLCIHPSPLTNLDYNFTNDTFFLATTANGLTSQVSSLNKSVCIFRLRLRSELKFDIVGSFSEADYSIRLISLKQAENEQVSHIFFSLESTLYLRGILHFLLVIVLHTITRLVLFLFFVSILFIHTRHLSDVDVAFHFWAPV